MRRINRCLNTRLIDICQRTVQLEELNLKLLHYLPESFHEHCHVGSFNRGCLAIVADDAVWASQLRYVIPELRDNLRAKAGIYQLSSIKVTVATTVITSSTTSVNPNPPQLSTKARDTIHDLGNHCNYLPLKQALHHLADVKDPNK